MSHTVFTEIELNTLIHTSNILKVKEYENYKIPSIILPDGERAPWEPEESIAFINPHALHGVKNAFAEIEDIHIIPGFRDFCYLTMAYPGLEGFIKRERMNFSLDETKKWLNKNGSPQATRKFTDLAVCFKTSGKDSSTRQEWEVHVKDFKTATAIQAFKETYPNIPDELITHLQNNQFTPANMLVKRAGFNAAHTVKDGIHTHVVHHANSADIGRILTGNLSATNKTGTNVLGYHTEFEGEVSGVSSTATGMTEEDLRAIIESSLSNVWNRMANFNLEHQKQTSMNKTETILHAARTQMSPEEMMLKSVKAKVYQDGKRLGAQQSYTQEFNDICNDMPDTSFIHAYASGHSTSLSRVEPFRPIEQPAQIIPYPQQHAAL